MSDDCQFKVGQRVTEVGHWRSAPVRISVVEKVSKSPKRVTLTNGSEWTWGGHMYFKGRSDSFYTGPRIRGSRAGDAAAIEKSRLVDKLEGMQREELEKFETWRLRDAVEALWPAEAK